MNDPFSLWLTTNAVTTWIVRNVASYLDPLIFKATKGRLTSMGRNSGRPRAVHLACIAYKGDYLVVASAMGQQKHPAWRYNLEANPQVEVQIRGESYSARAQLLSDTEKADLWEVVLAAIPQLQVYEARTDRKFGVFRLRRVRA